MRMPAAIFILIILIITTLGGDADAATSGIEGLRVERLENRPFLGVSIDDVPDKGVAIRGIVEGSAAEAAGLARGDVILEFDGIATGDTDALGERMRELGSGDSVAVRYLRDDAESSVHVVLGQRAPVISISLDRPLHVVGPDMRGNVHGTLTLDPGTDLADYFVCDNGEGCKFGTELVWYRLDCTEASCPTYRVSYFDRPMLGVQVTEMTPELRVHFGSDEETGVLISKVYAGSPARLAGVETGDVVVAVDGRRVDSPSDIERALAGNAGNVVAVEVVRDGRPLALDAELPEIDR